jgi:serine protease Do
MDAARLKSNKTPVYFYVILMLSMLVLPAVPATVVAQDDNAVAILRQIGRTFAEISKNASPSVVVLTVDKSMPRVQLDREPPGNPQPNPPELPGTQPGSPRIHKFAQLARGLGFIVSYDGHILTCNHIVKDAKKIKAKLVDGREFEAEIVGTDPDTDIAVLKIEAKNLPVLKLGDSDALKVGDWVVEIGNAMGVGRTFATGLVTAKNRSGLGMTELEDYLQTSINLQVGDGGGPLLDLDGNVVGINFARFNGERGGGISFAIPINMAKGIYEQLIKTGTVERGFLGVFIKDLDANLAKGLDLKTTKGLVIANVIKDSAAEKAGIKNYDVLVEFNGEPLESASRFILRVAALKPDTQVKLVVLRNGQRQNLTVTLGKRPQERKPDDIPNAP